MLMGVHCQSDYLEFKLNNSQGSINGILKYVHFAFVFDLLTIYLIMAESHNEKFLPT